MCKNRPSVVHFCHLKIIPSLVQTFKCLTHCCIKSGQTRILAVLAWVYTSQAECLPLGVKHYIFTFCRSTQNSRKFPTHEYFLFYMHSLCETSCLLKTVHDLCYECHVYPPSYPCVNRSTHSMIPP